MSNESLSLEQDCECGPGEAGVELLIRPRERNLGGFSVRRVLPHLKQRMVGPWIFFDHMGPVDFRAGEGINVRPHPHINLATVTYLFEGEILHRDSLGSLQAIVPGDINLMVAGRGIVHSERERAEITATDHRLHGLQLWLALPEALEEMIPAFHHFPAEDIPVVEVGGVPVRVMMGTAYGAISPVPTFAETLYVEAHLRAGQRLRLPQVQERALYVASGALTISGCDIPEYAMAVLSPGSTVEVAASREARIALIGGERMGHRFIEWNFVSSRAERIAQAREDWQQERFPLVPGDEGERISLP
ncbi:pirin family protein [Parahaliea aestuarii]|uniref:Pirin family protein n=1 Tax=Parahaliea aestuarii TaxID=1852021 RepID=A0A5C8ZS51_9GAMM|nr:pirin family protein [Parahaliea aestuarii]TXS90490.1 pirin family protein [Parahaliea aestuarii]